MPSPRGQHEAHESPRASGRWHLVRLIVAHLITFAWLLIGTYLLRDAWRQPDGRLIEHTVFGMAYVLHAVLGYLLVLRPRSLVWRFFVAVIVPIALPLLIIMINRSFVIFYHGMQDEVWYATQYMCSYFGTWLGMVLWWWRHPRGGVVMAHRRKLKRCMRRMVLASPVLRRTLLKQTIIGGIAMAGVVILLQFVLLWLLSITQPLWFLVVLWVAVVVGMWRYLLGQLALTTRDDVQSLRPCLACGASNAKTSFDANGNGECVACGEPIQMNHWLLTDDVPAELMIRPWMGTIIISLVIGFFMFWPWLGMQTGPLGAVPSVMLGITGLGFIAVNAINRMKRFAARRWETQHQFCRICRYALGGTSSRQGIGTCPECGTPFAIRVDTLPQR